MVRGGATRASGLPPSVKVTGWLTVTLATLGAAVCMGAVDAKRAERARNAELKTTRDLDMLQPLKPSEGVQFSSTKRIRKGHRVV